MKISQQLQRDIYSLNDSLEDVITDANMSGSDDLLEALYKLQFAIAEVNYESKKVIESIDYE